MLMLKIEKCLSSLPDPLRRVLFRNAFVWRLRNALARTAIVEMESPLKGYRMQLPRQYLHAYGTAPVEPEVVGFIRQVVKPGWRVVDIGAFAGYYTLLLSQLVGGKGSVYSFEPVPENCQMVNFNIQLNQCANVQVNQVAVGATDGEIAFWRSRGLYIPYGSLTLKRDSSRYLILKAKVCSLDTYLAELNWPRISFVKIDVEAAEAEVIQGMQEAIRRCPPTLVIEVHDGPPHDREQARRVLPLLFDLGYQVFSLQDDPGLKHPIVAPEGWHGHKHCVAVPRS